MPAPTFPTHLPRAFRLYLSGLATTAVAGALLFVALPFIVLGASGGPGAVVLAASLPRFLAPVLGTLADRLPGRTVLAGSALLRAALPAGVAPLVHFGQTSIPLLSVFAFLNALPAPLSFMAGSDLMLRLATTGEQR
jgi:hypothetical protein